MVPSCIAELVSSSPVVGFSGSRVAAEGAEEAIAEISSFVSSSSVVAVGCAKGVDQIARELFSEARVFSVASGEYGQGKSAFARRSMACVENCQGGLWLSFPAGPCPVGLSPSRSSSRCFSGFAAGSWSSLAFALGLGCRCAVWLPPSVSPPAGWGLVAAGGGWWVSSPSPVQLSLF